ncbi:CPBP family intramembrane metalloprotease [bacterium]|nr:CPBP family intramembrane metalloprotease [bacterium]
MDRRDIVDTALLSVGMCVFAFFVRDMPALSGIGLLAVAVVVGRRLWRGDEMADVLAFRSAAPRHLVQGASLGVVMAAACRVDFEMGMFGSLHTFALTGALIGATEELLYRGCVQERLAPLGALPAVAVAALAHTAYKLCLFAPSPHPVLHPGLLALWTFGGGLLFGALAWRSRSVVPPLLAHALFDTIVYGDQAAPAWVWH